MKLCRLQICINAQKSINKVIYSMEAFDIFSSLRYFPFLAHASDQRKQLQVNAGYFLATYNNQWSASMSCISYFFRSPFSLGLNRLFDLAASIKLDLFFFVVLTFCCVVHWLFRLSWRHCCALHVCVCVRRRTSAGNWNDYDFLYIRLSIPLKFK